MKKLMPMSSSHWRWRQASS